MSSHREKKEKKYFNSDKNDKCKYLFLFSRPWAKEFLPSQLYKSERRCRARLLWAMEFLLVRSPAHTKLGHHLANGISFVHSVDEVW
jgi:hypothetical protein